MITISNRVHHASTVLALHYETRSGHDKRDQAVDIIADLLHLCDARVGMPSRSWRQRTCTTMPK